MRGVSDNDSELAARLTLVDLCEVAETDGFVAANRANHEMLDLVWIAGLPARDASHRLFECLGHALVAAERLNQGVVLPAIDTGRVRDANGGKSNSGGHGPPKLTPAPPRSTPTKTRNPLNLYDSAGFSSVQRVGGAQ